MRKLIAILVIGATLWGGYWFIGAATVERSMAGWIEARRDDGWRIDHAGVDTRGFPNRFDTTITDLTLADPDGALVWSVPFFQLFALSYRPNHVIAVWPDTQTVETPGERIDIASDRMRGSLVFRPGTALALERANTVAEGLALEASSGWSARLDQARFAMHRLGVAEARYRIGAEVSGLAPAARLRRALGTDADLPPTASPLQLDSTADFTRPWDRRALEGEPPELRRLVIDSFRAGWGPVDLTAEGELEFDAAGRATGRIEVLAQDWRGLLSLAVAAGLVPEASAPSVERGLGVLADLSGQPDRISAPLVFQDGFVSLGPIPLGPAPRLVLR